MYGFANRLPGCIGAWDAVHGEGVRGGCGVGGGGEEREVGEGGEGVGALRGGVGDVVKSERWVREVRGGGGMG